MTSWVCMQPQRCHLGSVPGGCLTPGPVFTCHNLESCTHTTLVYPAPARLTPPQPRGSSQMLPLNAALCMTSRHDINGCTRSCRRLADKRAQSHSSPGALQCFAVAECSTPSSGAILSRPQLPCSGAMLVQHLQLPLWINQHASETGLVSSSPGSAGSLCSAWTKN